MATTQLSISECTTQVYATTYAHKYSKELAIADITGISNNIITRYQLYIILKHLLADPSKINMVLSNDREKLHCTIRTHEHKISFILNKIDATKIRRNPRRELMKVGENLDHINELHY